MADPEIRLDRARYRAGELLGFRVNDGDTRMGGRDVFLARSVCPS